MTARRAIVAVWLAMVLALPTVAGASPPAEHAAVNSRVMARQHTVGALATSAAAAGERYWGAVPCSGQIRIVAQRPLAAGVDPSTDAWVTFDSPLGANDLSAPAAGYTSCTIALARWRWPTASSMVEDWDLLCTTMTHELGHLLGHPHDSAPDSVMAPVFTDLSSEPASCRSTRPRG